MLYLRDLRTETPAPAMQGRPPRISGRREIRLPISVTVVIELSAPYGEAVTDPPLPFGASEIKTSPGTRSKWARLLETSGTEWRTASAAIHRSLSARA